MPLGHFESSRYLLGTERLTRGIKARDADMILQRGQLLSALGRVTKEAILMLHSQPPKSACMLGIALREGGRVTLLGSCKLDLTVRHRRRFPFARDPRRLRFRAHASCLDLAATSFRGRFGVRETRPKFRRVHRVLPLGRGKLLAQALLNLARGFELFGLALGKLSLVRLALVAQLAGTRLELVGEARGNFLEVVGGAFSE